jgi:hypothetical protein
MEVFIILRKTEDGYEVDETHQIPPNIEYNIDYKPPVYDIEPVSVEPIQQAVQFPFARVPTCGSWFDPAAISSIEEKSLPEFFNRSSLTKTPETYMHYRNFIIRTYRENPLEYLTATSCRRALVGDACAIIRIHAFLEKYGLINFEVDPSTRPQPVYSVALPEGIEYKQKVSRGEFEWCGYCGGICRGLWYVHPLITLCPKCYGEGNFPITLSEKDFRRQEGSEVYEEDRTEIDIELLKAVEKNRSDWKATANQLGKSVNECIWDFLKLPIREAVNLPLAIKSSAASHLSPAAFSDTSNPLLSQVYNSLQTQEVMGTIPPPSPTSSLEEYSNRIQELRDTLTQIRSFRELLDQHTKILQQEHVNFLVERMKSSHDIGLHDVPKIDIVLAPK